MNKRLLIGVIITECQIDFQEKILSGIISQAFRSKCDIAVLTTYHDFSFRNQRIDEEKKIFNLILSERFDGFLYDRSTVRDDEIQRYIDDLLIRSGKPVMLMDSGEHKRFEYTLIDDRAAFEELTDHMIDVHGCKSICCLTGPKNIFVSEERLAGFKDSLKKHGMAVNKGSCFYGDFWENAAKELAAGIINGDIPKPDAIVCGNDYSAIALTKALVSGGINVPGDIAVAGYDSAVEGAEFSPVITSFDRPHYQLGSEAFRRLYRLITGKICPKARGKRVGLRLGCSCGCNEKIRLSHREQRRQTVNKQLETDLLHRDMLFDVTAAEDTKELADRLDNYTYYMYKLRHMRICLTRGYFDASEKAVGERLDFSVKSEMRTLLAKSSMVREWHDDTYFRAGELPFFGDMPYPMAYYISPLSFGGNFFGFSAVSFGKEPVSFSDVYVFWINYLNVALEQLRIRSFLAPREPKIDETMFSPSLARLFKSVLSGNSTEPQYDKLFLLRERIIENPELPWKIGEIANDLYLSKSYLQKIYKEYFGKSIIEEMIYFRIEKAKELLVTTDKTVTDIAGECGYSSYNYFVRQFKTAEGIAPSEYRAAKVRSEE